MDIDDQYSVLSILLGMGSLSLSKASICLSYTFGSLSFLQGHCLIYFLFPESTIWDQSHQHTNKLSFSHLSIVTATIITSLDCADLFCFFFIWFPTFCSSLKNFLKESSTLACFHVSTPVHPLIGRLSIKITDVVKSMVSFNCISVPRAMPGAQLVRKQFLS